MDGVMRSIALEYGRQGVTANSVAPGWIETASSLGDELVAARSTPIGRAGTAAEAAAVAVFLASERGRLRHRPGVRRGRRQHHPGAARDRPVRRLGSRRVTPTPIGQETPVPPMPQ